MNKEISIKLKIAEHQFPLKVKEEREEEILRKAAKLLNDRFEFWQKEGKHQNFSKDKLMTVVALEVVTKLLEKNRIESKDIIEEKLEEIRILLEDGIMK